MLKCELTQLTQKPIFKISCINSLKKKRVAISLKLVIILKTEGEEGQKQDRFPHSPLLTGRHSKNRHPQRDKYGKERQEKQNHLRHVEHHANNQAGTTTGTIATTALISFLSLPESFMLYCSCDNNRYTIITMEGHQQLCLLMKRWLSSAHKVLHIL